MNYDNWKLHNGESLEKPIGYCAICDGGIHPGEEYYYVGVLRELLHYDCFDLDYAREALNIILKG